MDINEPIIGMLMAVLFVILSYVLYYFVIRDGTLLKSTMATYALGYPIGAICITETISIKSFSLFMLFSYAIFGFILWSFAYALESHTIRTDLIRFRETHTGTVMDWFYILIGVGSPKLVTFIN